MRKIAFILCIVLVLSSLCGCAKFEMKNAEKQRQGVVERFLEAIFLTDPDAAASCVPQELQRWIYQSCENQRWRGKDVKITLYEGGELDEDELYHIIEEYEHELGYWLSIDEAWLYSFEYTIKWSDGDTSTDSGAYDMIAALIDGQWYALPANL